MPIDVKTVQAQNTSDPGHFGTVRHFGNGAEVSYGHFSTR